MQWYLPMTIIPGVGLLILSTSNLMLALNNEISQIVKQEIDKKKIIELKLQQLKKLSYAIVFQYVGVLLFLLSVIINSLLSENELITKGVLLLGVLSIGISLFILVIYSIKAVSIRQKNLNI